MMKDLIVLVADKNMEFTIKGVLERIPQVEQCDIFSFDIFIHPLRDPGIYNKSSDFLRGFSNFYRYCIVVLDIEGSGQENKTREKVENEIEHSLSISNWKDRCCAIAIYPELENWIWVNSKHLHNAVSWDKQDNIYSWLRESKWIVGLSKKPNRPKEAFEEVLKLTATPRSSSIYYEITSKASYRNCEDLAFRKFITTIRNWFKT